MTTICADCRLEKNHLARGLCSACYHRQWAKVHRVELRAQSRRRRLLDPDRERARAKKWQANNPEKFRACMSLWRKNNPDKHRAAKANWNAANPGRHSAATRAWKKANADIVRALNAKRRAAKRGASENDFTAQQWIEMKAEHGQRCFYCRAETALTQDHVVPLSRGGSHTKSNIVPACQSCNSRKRTKDVQVFMGGAR
jgi:5-methylcytosine-specific restriction endonuclease McrA